MTTYLRRTDEGSTHWLGDDGYPACWRDHRECAEARVARLEKALHLLRGFAVEIEADATSSLQSLRASLIQETVDRALDANVTARIVAKNCQLR